MVRRNLRSLVMAAAILSLALGGKAVGQDEWQTVTSPDGSFTVEMPGEPHHSLEELQGTKGPTVIVHKYRIDQGNGTVTYLAQGAIYTDEFGISNPKSFLENYLKSLAGMLDGGKWSNVKWSTQQGAVTAEAIGVAGETDERFFAAVKGRNGVDLVYFGPRGTATSSDANRFFASLKIGDDMAPQRGLPPIESTPLQRDQP